MAETEKQKEADATKRETASTNYSNENYDEGPGEKEETAEKSKGETTTFNTSRKEEKYENTATGDEIDAQSTETVTVDSSLLNENFGDTTFIGSDVTTDYETMDESESFSPESLRRDLDLTSTGRDVSSAPMTDTDLRELATEPLILDERESLLEDVTDRNELSQQAEKLTVEITEIDKIEVYRNILAMEYLALEEVTEGKKSSSNIPAETYSNHSTTTLLESPFEVPVEAKEVNTNSQELVTVEFLGPPLEGEVEAERAHWNELERQELDIIEHTPDMTEPSYEHAGDQKLSDLELARLQQALEKQDQEWEKGQEEVEAQQGGREEETEKQEKIDRLNSPQLTEIGEVALSNETQVSNEHFELGQATNRAQDLAQNSLWDGDISQKQLEDLSFQFTEKDLLMTEMVSDISLYVQYVNPSEEIIRENINEDLLGQVTLTTQDGETRSLDEDTDYQLIDHESLSGDLEESFQESFDLIEHHPFEEILEEVQFLDNTTDLVSESYEEDLELVTQAPQLPEPPPYDFLQELEEQEELDRELLRKYPGGLRTHLVRSLEEARFRQHAVNYEFALRHGKQLVDENFLRPMQAQKWDHSEHEGSQDRDLKETEIKKEESFVSYSEFTPHKRTKFHVAPKPTSPHYKEKGLWRHLAFHTPILERRRTYQHFNRIIKTRKQEEDLVTAIINRSWLTVKDLVQQYAGSAHLSLNKEIVEYIVNEMKINLQIDFSKSSDGIYEVTSVKKPWSGIRTEFCYRLDLQSHQVFSKIQTNASLTPVEEPLLEEWGFKDLQTWIRELNNLWGIHPNTIFKTSLQRTISLNKKLVDFELKIDSTRVSSSDLQNLLKKRIGGYPLRTQVELPVPVKLRLGLFDFSSGKRIAGHADVVLDYTRLQDIMGRKNEEYVEKIIKQPSVIEHVLSVIGQDVEASFFYVSSQVTFSKLYRLPKNDNLDVNLYGDSEYAEYRIPDIIGINVRDVGGRIKVGLYVIDVKRSRRYFNQQRETNRKSTGRGRGWGQPLRDSLGAIHKIKSLFPGLSEDDIEVTCLVITADYNNHASIVTVDGDILIFKEPASRVLPFSGRVCDSNAQVFRLIRRIRDER